ncbi:putative salt-induced outer membrane protein [Oxalobacteraceae bacterium GrIS 2.11]
MGKITSNKMHIVTFSVALLSAAVTQIACAADPIIDDQWRGLGTLSLVSSSGNTESSTLNFMLNMDRQSTIDKWSFYLQDLNAKATTTTNGVRETSTTAALWRTGGRYDRNFNADLLGFVGLGLDHDGKKDLSLRKTVNLGVGDHVLKDDSAVLDVYGGVNLRNDKYNDPGVMVNNELKTSYNATELLLSEEFSYKFNENTHLKESFVAYPNLTTSGKFRSVFDISLSVAMNKTLSLTASFQDRYDNLAQAPIKPNDALLMVGVSMNLGPN